MLKERGDGQAANCDVTADGADEEEEEEDGNEEEEDGIVEPVAKTPEEADVKLFVGLMVAGVKIHLRGEGGGGRGGGGKGGGGGGGGGGQVEETDGSGWYFKDIFKTLQVL